MVSICKNKKLFTKTINRKGIETAITPNIFLNKSIFPFSSLNIPKQAMAIKIILKGQIYLR